LSAGLFAEDQSELSTAMANEAGEIAEQVNILRSSLLERLAGMEKALTRTTILLEAAGKAIEEHGWDMDFTHVDGAPTDHIGFSMDCESAVSVARTALSQPIEREAQ
jgi:hypothetical protein